jgi:hypothetical protein
MNETRQQGVDLGQLVRILGIAGCGPQKLLTRPKTHLLNAL